ncbi:MAG: 2-hydroxyglutaryl-CoA dehydratase [Candidatus Ornithospirochaeta sp.]
MTEKKCFDDCDYGFSSPVFTKEMKKTYTIITPDIFPLHLELVVRVFRSFGYNVEILHTRGKAIIDKGLEHIHNDMCYPAVCVAGQFIDALQSGKYDPKKTALVLFQTGGGCRASNYIWVLRKALEDMGMGYVPVLSLSLNGLEKHPGFSLTPSLLFKGLMAIVYGDMLSLLKNQTKPYEKNKGETDALLSSWIDTLVEELLEGKLLIGPSFRRNLKKIAASFASIERTGEEKTKVGIVGEIYVKYSPLGNNGLEDLLEKEDYEYMVPGVLPFFFYMFDNKINAKELYGEGKGVAISKMGMKFSRHIEKVMEEVLSEYPVFKAPFSFRREKELVDPILNRGVVMGEGWLLPAEVAELIELGYNNVICVQPFGCLPNHIVGKGTIRVLREKYPQANICPIDYDSSASNVNQENRIKLMLAMAREKK